MTPSKEHRKTLSQSRVLAEALLIGILLGVIITLSAGSIFG